MLFPRIRYFAPLVGAVVMISACGSGGSSDGFFSAGAGTAGSASLAGAWPVVAASGGMTAGGFSSGGMGAAGGISTGGASGGNMTTGGVTGDGTAGGMATGGVSSAGAGGTSAGGGTAMGDISPLLVGNNAWFSPSNEVWSATAGAGLKIVRIGGAQYDHDFPSNAQLTTWVNAIKALGAEPMIQVSQYRTAQQAADTVTYFNVTTNNPVKYWNIGNEPWLQRGKPALTTMAPIVAGYVKPLASAMKAVDPTIKIFAPDECEYFDDYYNALLGGSSDITGKDDNGRYYIDGISWHRYADTAALASDMQTRIQKTRTRVDYANARQARTGAAALSFGVGEFNSNADAGGPCNFLNGQAVGRTYGSLMKYRGTYATLWSMKEGGSNCGGTDFGFLNGDNSPRPSYYHMQLVSKNFSGQYADGTSNVGTVFAFGAVDSNKIVVMLLNQAGAQTCNVRLNKDAVAGACQINIDAGVAVTAAQAIGATTTLVLVFNRQGQLTKRTTYASGSKPLDETVSP